MAKTHTPLPVAMALRLASNWKDYRGWSPMLPYLAGKLRIVTGPGYVAAYTWLRRPYHLGPLRDTPTLQDWLYATGVPWIVDLVATPDADVLAMSRAIVQDMPIEPGEKLYYWRTHSGRYGFTRKRNGQPVQTPDDDDGG